ncbi:MAG TPA: hypothetical protein VGR61_02540 [Candidatus Dormibacteraeota bacterium]|nr:hypothetical protein [Candidatus Dormibacteraeota bacterium]
MRVSVRFVDGEHLEGDAEYVSLDRGGFKLSGPGGNTRSVWVGSGAIKYIVIKAPGGRRSRRETDPRERLHLSKVVLHFLDGEILHSYQDEVFSEEPGGFLVRLWDRERRQLVKALVSGSSLKGVFFVDEWDSRTEDETRSSTAPDEATSAWIDHAMATAEAPAPEVATPEAAFEIVDEPALQGPMLVEEPVLLEEPVLVEEPVLLEEPVVAIIVGDTEERRPSFRSALIPRRMVATAVPRPEELRYRLLRARISEVLGQAGPEEHEDDAEPEQET